ncbi:MAG: hypothetical protein ACE365_05160 [Gammaproteobacteria bacterium]
MFRSTNNKDSFLDTATESEWLQWFQLCLGEIITHRGIWLTFVLFWTSVLTGAVYLIKAADSLEGEYHHLLHEFDNSGCRDLIPDSATWGIAYCSTHSEKNLDDELWSCDVFTGFKVLNETYDCLTACDDVCSTRNDMENDMLGLVFMLIFSVVISAGIFRIFRDKLPCSLASQRLFMNSEERQSLLVESGDDTGDVAHSQPSDKSLFDAVTSLFCPENHEKQATFQVVEFRTFDNGRPQDLEMQDMTNMRYGK